MVSIAGIYNQTQQRLIFELLEGRKKGMGVLYYTAVATGLRLSDILALRAGDIHPKMSIIEGKTGKTRQMELSICLWRLLCAHREGMGLQERLWPWSRQTVYRHFREAAAELGLDFTPHGARKTYG